MADYSLAEQKVLKELGVQDFKHITKDNIVMLRTALDKCDPEVTQIPETLKFSSEYVSTVGGYTSKTLENDEISSEVINEQNLKNLGKIVLAVSCIIGGGYIVTKASNQDEMNQSSNEIN